MDINKMINTVKVNNNYSGIGMIASHLGVVRGKSLNGREVTGIEVKFDRDRIRGIICNIKKIPGIYEILIEISEGKLKVGDDIMAVVVGGDIRDHVFPALITAVNRIKKEAVTKKEFF